MERYDFPKPVPVHTQFFERVQVAVCFVEPMDNEFA